MQKLDDVQRALRARMQSEDMLKLVSTRVFLKTGVNLGAIKQTQNGDPAVVAKVVAALAAFGYSLN